MKRLSGMDSAFLHIETPAMHMHVVGTVVLDPSTMPGDYSFETIRRTVESRLHLLEPFRRRLVRVPLNLGHPFWIEDPDFDLDRHMLRVALPAPGGMKELAEFVGHFASRPLDHDRPLWEMWIVEGLEDGCVALVAKLHHCSIDGVSGADLMVHLFDLEATSEAPAPAATWAPEPRPSQLRLLQAGAVSQLTRPVGVARTVWKTGVGLARQRLLRQRAEPEEEQPRIHAPSTPFNGAITPHRTVAYGRVSLDDLKTTKEATGTKVNDVVLAACTMSLRHWLMSHDGSVDQPLVAACPVALPYEGEDERPTNAMTVLTVPMPVQLEDPVEQLTFIHEHASRAKKLTQALGLDVLQGWAEYTPPNLVSAAMRVYSGLDLADRHGPLVNLIVSNVPGPPVPLYTAGARVEAVYPMGPLLEGVGLNLTVLSNRGHVDFGVMACRELVPDAEAIASGFEEGVARLRKAVDGGPRDLARLGDGSSGAAPG